MPLSEFTDWQAYVDLNGPITDRRRYDHPAALVAWMVQRAQGGKAQLADFLPPLDAPDEPEDGFNDVDRQLLGGLKQSGQNRLT